MGNSTICKIWNFFFFKNNLIYIVAPFSILGYSLEGKLLRSWRDEIGDCIFTVYENQIFSVSVNIYSLDGKTDLYMENSNLKFSLLWNCSDE